MTVAGSLGELRALRRKLVKRYGKRSFRKFNQFFAAQSLVPDEPVFDTSLFHWALEMESNWRDIRRELDQVLKYRKELPRFYDITPDNKRIAGDDNWKSFVLYGFGYRSEKTCRLCPQTARLLEKVPGLFTAFFSILAPGAHIPRHRGVPKAVIRCHLGLRVPEQQQDCIIFIDDQPYMWEEGRALLFDDTYFHEVHNKTNEDRVILLIDFERPMTRLGQLASRGAFSLMRRTRFVKDAIHNQLAWEERFGEHIEPRGNPSV